MIADDLTFGSLALAPSENERAYGATKPPIPSPPSNLVNIGPFSIQKLDIPGGFYSNPASWSKSSTGSGHTEHEEDSREYRLELTRPEQLGINDPFRQSSPSYYNIEQDERLAANTARNANSLELNLPFPHIDGSNSSYHNNNSSNNNRTYSTYSSNSYSDLLPARHVSHALPMNEKFQYQERQKKVLQSQDFPISSQPRPLLHNPYHQSQQLPPAPQQQLPHLPTTGGGMVNPPNFGEELQHYYSSESRNSTPRSNNLSAKNSPTAAQALAGSGWKTLTPINPASINSLPVTPLAQHMGRGSTPTSHGGSGKYPMAPPASPAAAISPSYAAQQHGQAGVNGLIYQVQFKCASKNFILGSQAHPSIMIGDFVVVEADRGEDIGVVVEILPMKAFVERRIHMKAAVDDENVIGRILRLSSVAERQFLPEKFHDEENIVQFCRELAYNTYRLPMMLHDVEYQFDRHKLTIYYSSDARIDFREFVRDLFSAYKARIWMKKVPANRPVRIDNWASVALATGMQFTPENGK